MTLWWAQTPLTSEQNTPERRHPDDSHLHLYNSMQEYHAKFVPFKLLYLWRQCDSWRDMTSQQMTTLDVL